MFFLTRDSAIYLFLSLALIWLVLQLAVTPVLEPAEPQFPSTGHNRKAPLDVDGDGIIGAHDTILLLESIRDLADSLPLPVGEICTPHPFLDVDGDGYLSDHDARLALQQPAHIPHLAPAIGPHSPSSMQASAFVARR